VTVVVLVDRAGNEVGRTRWQDGTVLDGAPAEGAVLSLLRQALGLPPP
jgi:hypothetical protein